MIILKKTPLLNAKLYFLLAAMKLNFKKIKNHE